MAVDKKDNSVEAVVAEDSDFAEYADFEEDSYYYVELEHNYSAEVDKHSAVKFNVDKDHLDIDSITAHYQKNEDPRQELTDHNP